MAKYIALLRGINVGGKRKILMADLKDMFHKMNFSGISTYIQSGNVLFDSASAETNTALADRISDRIFENFGFKVPVIIRTREAWESAMEMNPFLKNKNIDADRLHLTLLSDFPTKEKLENIITYDYAPDKFEIIGNHVFICCSGKYSDSKLSNTFFENKLNVSATTRNWKTVVVLSGLAK